MLKRSPITFTSSGRNLTSYATIRRLTNNALAGSAFQLLTKLLGSAVIPGMGDAYAIVAQHARHASRSDELNAHHLVILDRLVAAQPETLNQRSRSEHDGARHLIEDQRCKCQQEDRKPERDMLLRLPERPREECKVEWQNNGAAPDNNRLERKR